MMFHRLARFIVSVALLPCLMSAARADTPAWSAAIAHVGAAPKLDGTLSDPVWRDATHIVLAWDYQLRRPASERTDAYLLTDGQFVYAAIVAEQREPITATLHTNDVTLKPDDLVRVYLWPGGSTGFEYGFVATPIGTHNEFSSENSAFAPGWASIGRTTAKGYIIEMRIPLGVMHGDGRSAWRLQVERVIKATGQDFVWAHDPGQHDVDDSTYVGYLSGMTVTARAARPRARVGVYALGQAGSAAAGGDTSHLGADISIPITDTASFFSTLHPDYSNVDLDQQTISPTAFQRQFREVRPFFTQGGNFYNSFNCNDCTDYPLFYSPNVPTPREGYAVEGVQGDARFAGFNALAPFGRTDDAQSLTIRTTDQREGLTLLRYATTCPTSQVASGPVPCVPVEQGGMGPAFHDDTLLYQLNAGNNHNAGIYFTGGGERGTSVSDPGQAGYREYGLNLYDQKTGFFPAYHVIGPQYAPVDGFVTVSDIHGPTISANHTFDGAPTSNLHDIEVDQDWEHFQNSAGALDLADAFTSVALTTRKQIRVQVTTGYQYYLTGSYGATIDQNGVSLEFGSGTSAPTSLSYNIGRFGPGYLRSTTRLATLRTGPRGTIAFEADDTDQTLDAGGKQIQWLERASMAYQMTSQSSLAIGVRRVIGTSPQVTPLIQPQAIDAANVSFAFYRHLGQDELYVVYGDPNQRSTLPAFIVKYVHYFGAQKGT